MKRGLVVVAGVAAIMGGVLIFAPEDRLNLLIEAGRRVTDYPAQRCLGHVRESLRDPDSARLLSSREVWVGPKGNQVLAVRATILSRDGTPSKMDFFCPAGDSARVPDATYRLNVGHIETLRLLSERQPR